MERAKYTPVTHEHYWTHDTPLFVGKFPYFQNEPRMVQGKVYVSEQRSYSGEASEIIPLRKREGTRHYVHMKPYVLEPEISLRVGMYPTPKPYADQEEAVGEVLWSELQGKRQHDIGNAQAWYYPDEKLLVIWECFLDQRFRTDPFAKDPHMRQLWQGFEPWLRNRFPQATRMATPFNDPIAPSIEEYQAFLHGLGYTPIAQGAFGKDL